jgi:uncharacterized protein (TIGR02270 family)
MASMQRGWIMNSKPAVIPVVIEQHAEEAGFLWLLRDAAVYGPHYNLADLAHLDDRVEAHIDGLRIAGEAGWEIGKEALAREEPGELFAAAVLAYESGDEDRIQTVLSVGTASPDVSRGLVSALGWLSYEQAGKYIQQLFTTESPDLRRIGIAAHAVHRQEPGRSLVDALSDADPLLKAQGLRAVGQLGRVDLVAALRSHLQDDDIKCRFSAGWSAALLGELQTLPVLRSLAETDFSHRREAMGMAVRIMDLSAAHAWQKELAENPETSRLAVTAAGVIGDSFSVPWLMEQMKIPQLSRVAGESFTMITGVDIAYENFEGERPEGFESGPTEDSEDENVEMDPDEDLPWPNTDLIEKWWWSHRGEFQNGIRYLCGKPMTMDSLQNVLRTGYQRQRAAAAIELAIRQPGQPLFEVRAPGFRQQELLGLQRTRG